MRARRGRKGTPYPPIVRVERVVGHGVFDGFEWPEGLAHFEDRNLIYGWNGTGKSTLARALRMFERPGVDGPDDIRVESRSAENVGPRDEQDDISIRVFNKEFIDENVFRTDGADMLPIVVLGKPSVDRQRTLKRAREIIQRRSPHRETLRRKLTGAERARDDFAKAQARGTRELLLSADPSYASYNRSRYEADVVESRAETQAMSDSDRSALQKQIQSDAPTHIELVHAQHSSLMELREKVAALARRSFVQAALPEVAGDPQLRDWLRDGVQLHETRSASACLYCAQVLPDERSHALETYFSRSLRGLVRDLDEVASTIQGQQTKLDQLPHSLPHESQLAPVHRAAYVEARNAVERQIRAASDLLTELALIVMSKRADPTSVPDMPTEEAAGAISLAELNAAIQSHNTSRSEFEVEKRRACRDLARDRVAQSATEYAQLATIAGGARERHELRVARLDAIEAAIRTMEAEQERFDIANSDLNADLASYLGHEELSLRASGAGYALYRHGRRARDLSEGERTAVALLYFLRSLDSKDFDLKSGVVVLDDPVSSLDQKSIFAAFGYIRSRTREAKQLLVLTHNFVLFRLLRRWLQRDSRRKRMYMLRCTSEDGERRARLRTLDPMLRRYDSEYHYMFSQIFRLAHLGDDAPLETLGQGPIVARCVLESFLAFRSPAFREKDPNRDELWERMLQFDGVSEARAARIFRFVNYHAHRGRIDGPEVDATQLTECSSVMLDLIAYMRAIDKPHVDGMEAATRQACEGL